MCIIILYYGDINLMFIMSMLLIITFVINPNTTLHLLLTAELLWITLYSLVTLIGFLYNDLNLVSLTFFFLIFSAVEFSVGLVLMLLQHLILRTTSLHTYEKNSTKYNYRSLNTLHINRLIWKN